MHVILWETRRVDVKPPQGPRSALLAQGLADRLAHFLAGRCRPPAPLLLARLAAVFKTLGHTVQHAVDRFPRRAELVVLAPTLADLASQRGAFERFLDRKNPARIIAVGPLAAAAPELLQDLGVTVVDGESEQLLWKLDAVLDQPGAIVRLGMVDDLDSLPLPEWAPFSPWLFRSSREFWQFPTARIEASRASPGLDAGAATLPGGLRYRSAESVIAEIREGIGRWGFYSFLFCDPQFGRNRSQVFQLAEQIGRTSQAIQFSIRSRADLLRPEMIRVLGRVGLSCVTLQIDFSGHSGPGDESIAENQAVVASCRRLGIRTIADFCITPTERASEAAGWVWNAARQINATFAEFHVGLPPADARGDCLPFGPIAVTASDAFLDCLQRHRRLYYARRAYWQENLRLLLPALGRLESLGRRSTTAAGDASHTGPPPPLGRRKQLARQPFDDDPSPHRLRADCQIRAAQTQPGRDDRHRRSA